MKKVDVSMSFRELAEINVTQKYGCKPPAPGIGALATLIGVSQGVPWTMILVDTIASFFRVRILATNHELFSVFSWIALVCAVGAFTLFLLSNHVGIGEFFQSRNYLKSNGSTQ